MSDFQQIFLVVGVILLSLGLFFAVAQLKRRISFLSSELEQIKNLFVAIQSGHIIQGKTITKNEKLLKSLGKKQRALDTQPKETSKSYSQASKMLNMGAKPEDIMDCCQLTRGEIQLLSQLQKSQLENNAI